MKKLIALFLVLAICLTLGACGAKEEEKKTDSSKAEQALSDLELGKKLLKEGKDNEAYAAFKKSDDPEAEIYLKCFDKRANEVEEIWYKSDGTVFSKAENGIWTYLSSDIGSFEFEVGQDKYGNKVYTSKKIEGNVTYSDLIGHGIYPKGESLYEYEYDDKGNIIRQTSTFLSNYETIYQYTYDKDDNVIKKVESQYDSEELVRKEISNYDKNGNIIMQAEYLHGYLNYKREYTYDSKNNKTLCVEYDENDKVIGKEEYEYDSNNNNTLLLEYDGNGKLESKTESIYNKDNQLVSSKTYDGNGVLTNRCEKAYDSESNLISSAEYDGNDKVINITKYDKYGRKTFEAGGYTANKELIEIDYTYDDKGNLILVDKHTEDGEPLEKIEQRYDENSELTYYANESFVDKNMGKYVYEYDNGVRRRRVAYNSEGILMGETLYDKHGNEIPDFSKLDGFDAFGLPTKGVRSFEYEYDDKGNLVCQKRYFVSKTDKRLTNEARYSYNQDDVVVETTYIGYHDDQEEKEVCKFNSDGDMVYQAKYISGVIVSETTYSYNMRYFPTEFDYYIY